MKVQTQPNCVLGENPRFGVFFAKSAKMSIKWILFDNSSNLHHEFFLTARIVCSLVLAHTDALLHALLDALLICVF